MCIYTKESELSSNLTQNNYKVVNHELVVNKLSKEGKTHSTAVAVIVKYVKLTNFSLYLILNSIYRTSYPPISL